MSVDEICRSIGADTLAYVSLEGLVASTGVSGKKLCRACFDGRYPITVPEGAVKQMRLMEVGADE